MLAYTVRRVLVAIPVIIVSSFMVFLLVALTGDPLDNLRGRNPPVPQQTFVNEGHRLWLDKSLLDRYWTWIHGLVTHGSFGPSVTPTLNIRSEVLHRFTVSIRLVLAAVIL